MFGILGYLVFLFVFIPLLLVLRQLTPNRLIRRKLRMSALLILLASPIPLLGEFPDDYVPPVLQGRLGVLAVIFWAWALVNVVVALLFNPFRQAAPSDRYPGIVQDALVVGCVVVLATLMAPEHLFATSAITALVLGLALQDTLGNLFAGLAIQIEKPFRVGDWIETAKYQGRVMEITWRATRIRTKSGMFVVIPNNLVSRETVVNLSRPTGLYRLEFEVGLGYEAHPNRVKQVMLDTVGEIPEILAEPKPSVHLVQYGDSAIVYRCRFWINDFALTGTVRDRFATLLYYQLKRARLEVPFPIRDVRAELRRPEPARPDDLKEVRLAFIERVDLFRDLDPQDKTRIADALEPITFGANEPVIQQGATGDSMFFIHSGRARVVLEKDRTAHQVAVLEPGDFFGEMALLTGEPRTASVAAMGDLEVFVLRKDAFRNVLAQNARILAEITRVIVRRKELLAETSSWLASQTGSQRQVEETLLTRIQKFFGF